MTILYMCVCSNTVIYPRITIVIEIQVQYFEDHVQEGVHRIVAIFIYIYNYLQIIDISGWFLTHGYQSLTTSAVLVREIIEQKNEPNFASSKSQAKTAIMSG